MNRNPGFRTRQMILAKSNISKVTKLVLLICLSVTFQPLLADDKDLQETLNRMEQLLNQQQQELAAQREELVEQRALIRQLQQAQGTKDRVPEQITKATSPATAPSTAETTEDSNPNLGQEKAVAELARQEQQSPAEKKLAEGEWEVDPSNTVYAKDFPGAWHLPGTTAAMKIGGYVNLAVVNSFDPLVIPDRFITGRNPGDPRAGTGGLLCRASQLSRYGNRCATDLAGIPQFYLSHPDDYYCLDRLRRT